MNLTADFVMSMLKEKGFEVYRNKPEMTLTQVVNDSNSKNVDLHIAIHSNAYNGDDRGCEVWHYTFSPKGKKLAQYIYNELSSITPTSDRGIKNTIGLYELRKVKAVSVIIEVAFHDNIDDANWIYSHKKMIAESIVKGICNYTGVK
jgi:N-acetylmuramoyl-L-alanine amidase